MDPKKKDIIKKTVITAAVIFVPGVMTVLGGITLYNFLKKKKKEQQDE